MMPLSCATGGDIGGGGGTANGREGSGRCPPANMMVGLPPGLFDGCCGGGGGIEMAALPAALFDCCAC